MIGRLTCWCKLTKATSSCDDIAEINEFDDNEGVPDDEPRESACEIQSKHIKLINESNEFIRLLSQK